MTTASLSRGSKSVSFTVHEQGGNLLVARDVGKPNAQFFVVGEEDPRFSDHLSSTDAFTVVGRLSGSSAYDDALTLAESVVKPYTTDTLSLDLSNITGLGTYDVGLPDQNSCRINYPAGTTNEVFIQLTCAVINDKLGGVGSPPDSSTTSGSGPVKLTDGSNTVTFSKGIDVERTVGRANSRLLRTADSDTPDYVDIARSTVDEWSITATLRGANARSDANTLTQTLIRTRSGRAGITLDFQGEYGLGSYSVAPNGSQATRVSYNAAEKNTVGVEALELRTITT